jgi:aminopeptidase-like protein
MIKNLSPINLSKKLFPINRSLSGKGNRETLFILKKIFNNLVIKNFKSNLKVYDWKIPKEWIVNDAYIITPDNKKICQFKKNNLHLVGYSHSIKKKITLKNLNKNLHSIPDQPTAIPYITSYYEKNWGFCIDHNQRKKLKPGDYQVFIDTKFKTGKLNYGEILINGHLKREILFSTYICHPSMANDEVSGIVVSLFLANYLKKKKRKYSYRFIFIPETIGSIAYIHKNLNHLKGKMLAGFVLSCVGDDRCFSFLPSKYQNKTSDKILKKIFDKIKSKKIIYHWNERGSDERQFCSPHVDLPVSSIMRSKYMEYPEYHTSLDKIGTVVTNKGLKQSIKLCEKIVNHIEKLYFPISTKICEPFMTKHKLYSTLRNKKLKSHHIVNNSNVMNFLTWCDGNNSLDEIAERARLNKNTVNKIFNLLLKKKLIKLS